MQAKKTDSVIEKVELELLSTLFKYVAPFIEKKIDAPKKDSRPGSLESLVNRQKISIKDFKELESLLMKSLGENINVGRKTAVNSKEIFYSISMAGKKKDAGNAKYSVTISYEENSKGEKLGVRIKKDGKEVYSAESSKEKDIKDKVAPYGISISYEDRYGEERLAITYRQQLKNYMKKHIESREDMTNMVPLKWLNIFPESMMGGILGFTYLGENFMGRRADLTGKTARMVDIHESIHTPDEYETRILTSWMMEKARSKYIK